MKKFLSVLLILLIISGLSIAAVKQGDSVAIMDFGIHPAAVPIDINVLNAGLAANEYITERIVSSKKLDVVDRSMIEETILKEGLNTVGLIDADTARELGELLNVQYIIYGNVNDVTLSDVGTSVLSSGITVCTVKSHVIVRMMNVESGQIIAMSKGEGKSKSSFVRVSGGSITTIDIGNATISQDSVHNAIKQASFQAADALIATIK